MKGCSHRFRSILFAKEDFAADATSVQREAVQRRSMRGTS